MSLSAALALADQGFHVFPLVAGGKLPAITAFASNCTRDPARIRAMFYDSLFQRDHGYNVGIYCGKFGDDPAHSLIAIDVDNKDGKNGSQQLAPLAPALGLTDTYTQQTPTGGFHVVYRSSAPVANSVGGTGRSQWPSGLDIRGRGGFIVGAGSTTEKGCYTVAFNATVADAASALVAMCAPYVPPRDAAGNEVPDGIDEQAARRRVEHYLSAAPLAVQGSGGDATTFQVCCFVKDQGVSEVVALELLLALWNDRCTPPWEASDLQTKVANAYRHGRNAPGSAAPECLFKAVTHGAMGSRSQLVLTRADSVTPEPIRWLWPGWIAAGKFHVLAGAPGTGKTTVALTFAAVVSRGGQWPDGSSSERGRVLVWSGEDSVSDTLTPRLIAARAALSGIEFISGRTEGGGSVPFDPARDAPLLSGEMQKGDVRLLIIDPIVSAVQGDSHKNAEVRRALQALVDVCERHDCAIIGINHFSKGTQGRDPTERVTGSLAFGAMARVVLATGKHRAADGSESSLLVRTKSNVGKTGDGFTYEFVQAPLSSHPGVIASAVKWLSPVAGGARELLATAESEQEGTKQGATDEAVEWLCEILAGGPVDVSELDSRAKDYGIKGKTLRNAKDKLAIESKKTGMGGGWQWSLPEGAPAKPNMPNTERGAPS